MAPAPAPESPHARSYPIEELLGMQDAPPLSISDVERLNQHPEICKQIFTSSLLHADANLGPIAACLVRVPEQSHRSLPSRLCNLVDITNRRHNRQQSTMHNSDASVAAGESREMLAPSSASSNKHDTQSRQWFLQRRDSSDDSSQPHSAPSGSSAQQSENFQRFYQAVVSPTHVRVTAGGKIVRNTRSPAFEWNSDKHHFEPLNHPQNGGGFNAQPPNWHQNIPIHQGFPGFPAMMPGNFMPPHGNFFPQAFAPPQFNGGFVPEQKSSENDQNRKATDRGSFDSQNTGSISQPIKISPPNQFDQTKPFMYNGQLVYPVPPPPNGLPVPMTMLGNPNFIPQNAHIGGFTHGPHFPMPVPGMQNALMFPHGQPLPLHMPHPPPGSEPMHPMAPFAPQLMPMPVLSELTRKHIQVLQDQLKILDSQPAGDHNSQQSMQMQRAMVLAGIKQMESMLDAQLAQESPVRTEAHSEPKLLTAAPHDESKSATPKPQQVGQLAIVEPQGEANLPTLPPDVKQEKKPSIRADPLSKSKLSAAAAMAPPFQPRSHIVANQPPLVEKAQCLRSTVSNESLTVTGEVRGNIESRLLLGCVHPWIEDKSTPAAGLSLIAPPRLQKAESMRVPKIQIGQPAAMPRSNTFHGKMDSLPPNVNSQPIPYLVGILPGGSTLTPSTHHDLVYPRELNEHELQARQLYWGKAPKSVAKGLPKFDGKDFYPPSPVKESVRMAAVNVGADRLSYSGPTSPTQNFENLFMEPGVNGYKPPPQVRYQPGYTTLGPVPKYLPLGSLGNAEPINHYGPQSFQGPRTPPATGLDSTFDDFSGLFLERGVNGYQSPAPKTESFKKTPPTAGKDLKVVVTSKDSEGEDELGSAGTTDSFDVSTYNGSSSSGDDKVVLSTVKEEENDHSTETFPTATQKKVSSPTLDLEGSFEERVAKFAK